MPIFTWVFNSTHDLMCEKCGYCENLVQCNFVAIFTVNSYCWQCVMTITYLQLVSSEWCYSLADLPICQLSLWNWKVSSMLAMSSVYNIPGHMINVSDLLCGIFINTHPQYILLKNVAFIWDFAATCISGSYMSITWGRCCSWLFDTYRGQFCGYMVIYRMRAVFSIWQPYLLIDIWQWHEM